jgi:hypothetical protein
MIYSLYSGIISGNGPLWIFAMTTTIGMSTFRKLLELTINVTNLEIDTSDDLQSRGSSGRRS